MTCNAIVKRIPAAITRSASSVLLLAATEPCIPTIPEQAHGSLGNHQGQLMYLLQEFEPFLPIPLTHP